MKSYWVYILSSGVNGTLYIGVTNDIIRRVYEHKQKLIKGFTKKYSVTFLVYAEEHSDIDVALAREKAMKKWNRAWKIKLIEENNPYWIDLYEAEFSTSVIPSHSCHSSPTFVIPAEAGNNKA